MGGPGGQHFVPEPKSVSEVWHCPLLAYNPKEDSSQKNRIAVFAEFSLAAFPSLLHGVHTADAALHLPDVGPWTGKGQKEVLSEARSILTQVKVPTEAGRGHTGDTARSPTAQITEL